MKLLGLPGVVFWWFFNGVGNPGVGGGPPRGLLTPLNSAEKLLSHGGLAADILIANTHGHAWVRARAPKQVKTKDSFRRAWGPFCTRCTMIVCVCRCVRYIFEKMQTKCKMFIGSIILTWHCVQNISAETHCFNIPVTCKDPHSFLLFNSQYIGTQVLAPTAMGDT